MDGRTCRRWRRRLQLEADELLPLGETLQLLGLGVLEEGDLRLTDKGRAFVEADTDDAQADVRAALAGERAAGGADPPGAG